MPEELHCNKIVVDGETRLDLTEDTVSPEALLFGATAHDASGAPIVGSLSIITTHNDLSGRSAPDAHPLSAITGLSDALEDKYELPSDGIPESDLASAVQALLDKADTAVQPEEGKGLFSGDYNDLANKPNIPVDLSDLTDDATHRLVTDTEKSGWNSKQDAISDLTDIRSGSALGATAVQPEAGKGLFSGDYNDLTNKPDIPVDLSDLTDDATHRLVTDTEKSVWNSKQDAIGYTTENVANKVTSISSASTDTEYPSAKAVYDYILSLDGNGVLY